MTCRSWRNRAQRLALCACAAGLLPLAIASQENEPKPVKKVMPAYPDVLKRMGISGTVRVRVTIAPDGSVRDVEARGGSAIFAEAVTKAVTEGAIRQAIGREFLTSRWRSNVVAPS